MAVSESCMEEGEGTKEKMEDNKRPRTAGREGRNKASFFEIPQTKLKFNIYKLKTIEPSTTQSL